MGFFAKYKRIIIMVIALILAALMILPMVLQVIM